MLSGDDELTLPMMGLGATGVISVAATWRARSCARWSTLRPRATTPGHCDPPELLPLFKALFMTANPIMVKKALEQWASRWASAACRSCGNPTQQTAELRRESCAASELIS